MRGGNRTQRNSGSHPETLATLPPSHNLDHGAGLEPAPAAFKAQCSTIKLPVNCYAAITSPMFDNAMIASAFPFASSSGS